MLGSADLPSCHPLPIVEPENLEISFGAHLAGAFRLNSSEKLNTKETRVLAADPTLAGRTTSDRCDIVAGCQQRSSLGPARESGRKPLFTSPARVIGFSRGRETRPP